MAESKKALLYDWIKKGQDFWEPGSVSHNLGLELEKTLKTIDSLRSFLIMKQELCPCMPNACLNCQDSQQILNDTEEYE